VGHGLDTWSTGVGGVAALDRPSWLPAAGAGAVWQAGGGVVTFSELRRRKAAKGLVKPWKL
jgi:hypothetical protein